LEKFTEADIPEESASRVSFANKPHLLDLVRQTNQVDVGTSLALIVNDGLPVATIKADLSRSICDE
jgi:hypothetical protein